MPWGKFKGKAFAEIPIGYLGWLLGNDWLGDDIRSEAEKELKRRSQQRTSDFKQSSGLVPDQLRPMAKHFLDLGFKSMAKRCHPDIAGGSHELMLQLQEVYEILKRMVSG